MHPHVPGKFLVYALFALLVCSLSPAAHAATGDLICTLNFQLNFNPALTATHTSADVQASAGLVNCSSPNGSHSDLLSATAEASGKATSQGISPCNLLLTATGAGTVTWNTGEKSKANFTLNTNPTNGTVTVTATVTSGPLSGDTVTVVPVVAHPNADCAVNGLRSLTSEVTQASFN